MKPIMRIGLLVLVVLVGIGAAGSARAMSNPTAIAGAFAAPYMTGTGDGDVVTSITITNASTEASLLQIHVLNGDPGGDWEERSMDCFLTANETTVMTIVGDGAGADLAIECSETTASAGTPAATKSLVSTRSLPGRRGTVFVALKDPATGDQVADNRLLADWTVLDFAAGTSYAAEAFGMQALGIPFPLVDLTDRAFDFVLEYAAFPSAAASNFIAPDCTDPADPTTCDVDVELILFTLDGRAGDPPPQSARLDFYNDDERLLDNVSIDFECFEVVRLLDLDPDFNAPDLCSVAPLGCVGHFTLTPRVVDVFTGHDNPTGFGGAFDDNERLSHYHGWIVHRFRQGGTVLNFDGGAGVGMANDAATARLLLLGANSNTGLGLDRPTLDLD